MLQIVKILSLFGLAISKHLLVAGGGIVSGLVRKVIDGHLGKSEVSTQDDQTYTKIEYCAVNVPLSARALDLCK